MNREQMSRLRIELHGLRMLNSEFVEIDPVIEAEKQIERSIALGRFFNHKSDTLPYGNYLKQLSMTLSLFELSARLLIAELGRTNRSANAQEQCTLDSRERARDSYFRA